MVKYTITEAQNGNTYQHQFSAQKIQREKPNGVFENRHVKCLLFFFYIELRKIVFCFYSEP